MLKPSDLRGSLIAAVPVTFDAAGQIDLRSQRNYADWMASQPVEGVAVWAHTGRGLRLTSVQRELVLRAWREVMGSSRFVVAAAGAASGLVDPAEMMISARTMAGQACDLGADMLLIHPPVAFRDRTDRDSLILDYHGAIAQAGLPMILFYLYEEAGGIRYSEDVLTRLLSMPEVLGIKVATLDSVMTFQDLAALIEEKAPGKVLVTGEDRFLGYSFMCGARAALIGMGAACTGLQHELMRSYRENRFDRFVELNRAVDDLARHTFKAPMEGYIRRMLWCLVHQGIIPEDSAHDPWGPRLDPAEFESLRSCLQRIAPEELRRAGP
jgi:4-hydroxy-tetrahydrodipicolinate synthase